MSRPNMYVDNLFDPLDSYFDNLKAILYSIQEEELTNPENNVILNNAKNMLNNIMLRLDSYKTNIQSMIEHIDTITSSTGGGKKYKKYKKKTRKNRRN